jgi:hypothetical protein
MATILTHAPGYDSGGFRRAVGLELAGPLLLLENADGKPS